MTENKAKTKREPLITITRRAAMPKGKSILIRVAAIAIADALALRKLREASCIERTATIRHGYCPVRVGDVVTVDAPSMSLQMDALVKRQEIELGTAFTVTSTLAVREELWNG